MNNIDSKNKNNIYNKYINIIITIQKYIRRYLIIKNILIPHSYYQTKNWRKNRKWYINGKKNECEIYQRKLFNRIIKLDCSKTTERINMDLIEIIDNKNPMKEENGFEWTEDFDGKIILNNNILYINFKFVCDEGGAQTRSLREVYHFIKYQIKYLIKNKYNNEKYECNNEKYECNNEKYECNNEKYECNNEKYECNNEKYECNNENIFNLYFINILDGNTSWKHKDKFNYLLNKFNNNDNLDIKKYIFIGNMYEFQKYWITNYYIFNSCKESCKESSLHNIYSTI